MENIPHFSFDEHTRNNIVSLLKPFNCSTDIFMCSKKIEDSAHLFESVEDAAVWGIENKVYQIACKYFYRSDLKNYERKDCLLKLDKKFKAFKASLSELEKLEIEVVELARRPKFEDPIESYPIDKVLTKLQETIEFQLNSVEVEREMSAWFGKGDQIKRQFLFSMLNYFASETGEMPTTTRGGKAGKFLKFVWNPIAKFVNQYAIMKDGTIAEQLLSDEVVENIISKWIRFCDESIDK